MRAGGRWHSIVYFLLFSMIRGLGFFCQLSYEKLGKKLQEMIVPPQLWNSKDSD